MRVLGGKCLECTKGHLGFYLICEVITVDEGEVVPCGGISGVALQGIFECEFGAFNGVHFDIGDGVERQGFGGWFGDVAQEFSCALWVAGLELQLCIELPGDGGDRFAIDDLIECGDGIVRFAGFPLHHGEIQQRRNAFGVFCKGFLQVLLGLYPFGVPGCFLRCLQGWAELVLFAATAR